METTSAEKAHTSSRNLGRAARRRRKKILEIAKAEAKYAAVAAQAHSTTTVAAECSSSASTLSLHPTTTTATTATTTTTTSSLPTDRGNLREPVIQWRQSLDWNSKDENALVRQMGFVPGNAIRVCCRVGTLVGGDHDKLIKALSHSKSGATTSDSDDPIVLKLYPLALRDEFSGGKSGRRFKSRKRRRTDQKNASEKKNNNTASTYQKTEINATENGKSNWTVLEPFPTMYWLTHPLLRLWVSKLEVNGFGIQLEKRLKENSASLDRMKIAHAAYGRARLALLTDHDRQDVKDRNWEYAVGETRGVAGIRNYAAVKCLHAHTAHHLSGDAGSQDNVVGAWVMEAIREMIHRKGQEGEAAGP